ncbi:MAG: DUF4345 domain-containing protein [Pseudomonadota bacterium]
MSFRTARLISGFSGAVLLAIGAALVFEPLGFAASNGVVLPNDVSVLSEYRAPGGLLVVVGLLMLVSAFSRRHLATGLWAGALVYCSYGGARLLGYVIDGAPSSTLVQAMVVEWVIGLACLAAAAGLAHASYSGLPVEAVREGN